eukprot:147257-Hanusia_phi.AAC.1
MARRIGRVVVGLAMMAMVVGGGGAPMEREELPQQPSLSACRHVDGEPEGQVASWRKEDEEGAQVLVVEPGDGEIVESMLYIAWEVLYFDMADGFVEVRTLLPAMHVDGSSDRDRWRSG